MGMTLESVWIHSQCMSTSDWLQSKWELFSIGNGCTIHQDRNDRNSPIKCAGQFDPHVVVLVGKAALELLQPSRADHGHHGMAILQMTFNCDGELLSRINSFQIDEDTPRKFPPEPLK